MARIQEVTEEDIIHIGDVLFYVNSGNHIDEYVVKQIEGVEALVVCKDFGDLQANINLNYFNKLGRLFRTYEEALTFKKKLDEEQEKRKLARFDEILQEALNSVTLDEVLERGNLLKSKAVVDNKGKWQEAYLYEYNNRRYVVIYEYQDFRFRQKQCIRFSEV